MVLLGWAALLLAADSSSAGSAKEKPPKSQRASVPVASQPLDAEFLAPRTSAANADTTWFVTWDFGTSTCDASGWTADDNRILNDGSVYWHMETSFAGQGGITGQAAAVGEHGDACCVSPDGYANDWYQAIRLTYTGAATLSFDYLLDSEPDYDFLQLETDSLCASFDRVDYDLDPSATASSFRDVVLARSGLELSGSIVAQNLTAYGPGTHCVYIAFFSDAGYSPCDGEVPNTIGEAMVVDDISITDAGGTRGEDFEDGTLDIGTFVNLQDSEPFGMWARLHTYATDNDVCAEALGCSWIFTDPALPAANPDLAFGPGGTVVRSWIDNVVTSPWVSLPPGGVGNAGNVLEYRYFGGSSVSINRIVHRWMVRTRRPAGGGTECVSAWNTVTTNSLYSFKWQTAVRGLGLAVPADATAIQVRYRVFDYQYIQGVTPDTTPLGPGPYLDRVRLGRRVLLGPAIGSSFPDNHCGQDNFASDSILVDGRPTFTPSADIFGSADFGRSAYSLWGRFGTWIGWENDALRIPVTDSRGAGGITGVALNGAIVAGPHAGKAPPPWTVGSNGFFQCPATDNGSSLWSVDLDDDYFRGGDVLYYFISATDAAGGFSTLPDGMNTPPASVAEAEAATGGLFETSFLPSIDWDPAYRARIVAHPSGKLEPTSAEIAGSQQRTCILYAQFVARGRRSGTANRTAFMYTLDRLGYAGLYDTYDNNTVIYNGQIAGHAAVEQAAGYALIVYDTGNTVTYHALPLGGGREDFWPQTQWFQDWLAQAPQSASGTAALWILGENLLEGPVRYLGGGTINPLLNGEMGVTLVAADQGLALTPRVEGQASFNWADSTSTDFTGDRYALDGVIGCGKTPRGYDGLGSNGTATVTHRWAHATTVGSGAVVMNASPAANWNTIFMSYWWDDLRTAGDVPGSAGRPLLSKLLDAVLPAGCQAGPDSTTDTPEPPALLDPLPRVTALLPNVPNPFNPVTTIHFDLGRDGRVRLQIHDAAGRLVRTLLDGERVRRHYAVVWDGLDDAGRRVASGVYFTRLHTADGDWTRKLVVLR